MKIDLLIQNAQVFNTMKQSFEIKNVTVAGDKFYYISTEDLSNLAPEKIIDASGQYLIPGLLDIHMHIESSMTTPTIFSKAVLPFGVTTVVADAHEMANVFGIEGQKEFMKAETEVDIFYAIPSSVPSTTPELETTGGIVDLPEVADLLQDPRIICLGEAMNFKGISYEPDSLIRQIIALCQKERPTMPLEGHCPKVYQEDLAAFLYSGITSDHTHQFPESLYEKIINGMFIQFQNKSITPENMAVIVENNFYDYACLITDDVMADDLLTGHLNENLKKAVAAGLPVEQAIYMTTYTPARRMSLNDRGIIAPGRLADFILLDDLADFSIAAVYKKGQQVFQKGDVLVHPGKIEIFPESYYQTVNCRQLTAEDLRLKVATDLATVRCNVIQKQEVGTFTEPIVKELPVIDGYLAWEDSDCCLLITMERYGKNGNISYALIEEAITEKGAIATTWAHDHHNLMVMGNDVAAILKAQQELLAMQGGYVVVAGNEISGRCPLPIGGIVSQAPISELGADLQKVRAAMQNLGYRNMNEIMSFSTLSLPVSPAIKVTDFGMMNTREQTFYPLIFPEDGRLL
ncbi:adenine deaminase [Enterococcus sp. PF1-24]|uniref:adenine deaminase C-terminal domain-containing protein n=1 Tax=unclassified Enterococcus TaxID=2608891 RepID=UPI0024730566|nr:MULTISPECIES: adenine deaminase C-terminal domain-containing protein [unclassified Enterococcus]MDH6363538.1 adenine deaminase [Enterococcus sp. PFB1-1]MDH6400773.1 adenine deaminase [Enterococcus sp. PF1-24]